MTQDYRRRKDKYILPTAVYHQTLWQIRDYYRLRDIRDEILQGSGGPPDGMPGGSGRPGNPTQAKAIKLAETSRLVTIIDEEIAQVPEEYRKGVWNAVQFREPFPVNASRQTYSMWKSFFVYCVAKRLKLIL